jgi:hypothetical protein
MTTVCTCCQLFPAQTTVSLPVCGGCSRTLPEAVRGLPPVLATLVRDMARSGRLELTLLDSLVLSAFGLAPEGERLRPRDVAYYLATRAKLKLPTTAIRRSMLRLERCRYLRRVGGGGHPGASDLLFERRDLLKEALGALGHPARIGDMGL